MEQDAVLMGHEEIQESEDIYLPASFLGSARWSSNQIADLLTIAATYGLPTFFVTFTCNVNGLKLVHASDLGRHTQIYLL
jgi:hypothetical protein